MEFRIGISLTRYFDDERSMSYLYMDKSYNTVSQFEDYMRRVFDIKGEFCLLANNYYLPSDECSKIIQPGDKLTVIPKSGWQTPLEPACITETENDEVPIIEVTEQIDDISLKQGKKKKKKKSKGDIEDNVENKLIPRPNSSISSSKKAKKDSITSDDIFETQNDGKKDSMDISIACGKKDSMDISVACGKKDSMDISVACGKKDSMDISVACGKKDSMDISVACGKKDSMDISVAGNAVSALNIDKETVAVNDIPLEQETVTSNVTSNEIVNNQSAVDETAKMVLTEMDIAMQQLKSKALLLLSETSQKVVNGVTAGRVNKRKRIRKRKNKNSSLTMSVATPDVTETALPASFTSATKKPISHIRFNSEEQPLIIQNPLANPSLPVKPRIIHALDPPKSISTNSLESSVQSTGSDPQSLENDEDRPKESISWMVSNEVGSSPIESLKLNLKNYPPMDAAVYPVTKDIILFKMLKMDDNYTPVVSDYILGRVLDVDKVEGIVKLDIIDGLDNCSKPNGKFSLDEEIEPVKSTIIDVEWIQVLESRLIFQ